jgi:hypothetical protein
VWLPLTGRTRMQTFRQLVAIWLCALAIAFSLSVLHEYFEKSTSDIVYAGLIRALGFLFLATVFVSIRGLFRLVRR